MTADLLAAELGALPAPGSWRAALWRPDAPGAVLDSQPWARTWGGYLRALFDPHDPSVRTFIANAMTERVPSQGGFLVPENLRSQVMSYMTTAVVRPNAMVLPMDSLRLPIPVLDNPTQNSGNQALGGLTFSFTEEGAAISASVPSFGRTVLEAHKLAAYLQDVPNELVDDAAGPFGDFLARVIARGYGWAEDDSFFNGTGVGQPQGLIYAPSQVTVTRGTSSKVLLTDIAAMFKVLHPAARQDGFTPGVTSVRWLVSSTAMDQILELYLAVGTPANQAVAPSDWFQAGDGDKVGPSILGLPVSVTDHQPAVGSTGDVMLADISQYLIGDRLEMTVERSAQGAGFIKGTSNFRVRSRVDGRYWIQFTTTTEAGQTVGPVVVLQ
ncbi:MAG TPA: phage major capsid protein [Streptosporangiaceae bacterium]|nr:phage major capsid protein [Streptosporangiaceae bacterium]